MAGHKTMKVNGDIMKKFNHIAQLVKEARVKGNISQTELSHKLKYRNGQFISNIERGICSIPAKRINDLAKVLDLSPKQVADAMINDFTDDVLRHVG